MSDRESCDFRHESRYTVRLVDTAVSRWERDQKPLLCKSASRSEAAWIASTGHSLPWRALIWVLTIRIHRDLTCSSDEFKWTRRKDESPFWSLHSGYIFASLWATHLVVVSRPHGWRIACVPHRHHTCRHVVIHTSLHLRKRINKWFFVREIVRNTGQRKKSSTAGSAPLGRVATGGGRTTAGRTYNYFVSHRHPSVVYLSAVQEGA